MSKIHWSTIHDESIAASKSLRVLARINDGYEMPVLFEREDEGLYMTYYFTAQDALDLSNRVADICYGWDIVMAEDKDEIRLAWLDRVSKNVGSKEVMSCEHDGYTCEQMFHTAQVILGNEDEDNCGTCQRYGLNT